MSSTNQTTENLKSIIMDIKKDGFTNEIPKKDLILIISKYVSNPYPYINRLWSDGYIKEINKNVFKILKL